MRDMFQIWMAQELILDLHCTQFEIKLQMVQAVKGFACKPIPFANCAPLQLNEFERVYERLTVMLSNGYARVLHDFSLAVLEVRGVGTSKRKKVIQCV